MVHFHTFNDFKFIYSCTCMNSLGTNQQICLRSYLTPHLHQRLTSRHSHHLRGYHQQGFSYNTEKSKHMNEMQARTDHCITYINLENHKINCVVHTKFNYSREQLPMFNTDIGFTMGQLFCLHKLRLCGAQPLS